MIETLAIEPQTIPSGTNTKKDPPMLPEHVLLAALRYTEMVQGQPEHWMSLDEAFESIYKEMGWK